MLTKLLPDQIAKLWDIIRYAIEQSLPPIVGEHPDKMNRLLSSMLSGKVEVWASYTKEERKFEGIVVTQLLYDDASNTKNLLIYCLYGYVDVNTDSWKEGWEALNKYAKSLGCHSIMAYSTNQFIVDIVKKLDGSTSYTFLSFDVK